MRSEMPTIPDFTDPIWQAGQSDSQLRKSISDGSNRLMPAMKRKLTPADIDRLLVLVRWFEGGRHILPDETDDLTALLREPVQHSDGASHRFSAVGAPIDARAIYQRSCQLCHGADGRGAPSGRRLPGIPDFTSKRWQESRSQAKLATSILEGRGEKMPAFRGKLGNDQVSALVTYVRAFASRREPSPNASSSSFDSRLDHLQSEFEELGRAYRQILVQPYDRPSPGTHR
jgi:cytochrome c5